MAFLNDIALVALKSPIKYNKRVQPVCILPKTLKIQFATPLTASGFGFKYMDPENWKEDLVQATTLQVTDIR